MDFRHTTSQRVARFSRVESGLVSRHRPRVEALGFKRFRVERFRFRVEASGFRRFGVRHTTCHSVARFSRVERASVTTSSGCAQACV